MSAVSDAEKAIRARPAMEEVVATAPIADLKFPATRSQLCPYPTNGSFCEKRLPRVARDNRRISSSNSGFPS